MSIKDKYYIDRIFYDDCKEWILQKHYAKRMPSISYAFGLFDENKIIRGVCTFGSPPSHSLCVGISGENYSSIVLELNRLVCLNEKNIASFFVSQCLKKIESPKIIVSYADTSQNHTGYVYQSTNWIYTGLSAKRTERYDENNPNMHSKSITERKNVIYQDLAVRDRPQKHRYIFFIGSKKEKKEMLKALKYPILPYPKGNNKRYDASYDPIIQPRLF